MPPTAFIITHESNPERRRKAVSLIALALTRALGRHGVRVVRIHPNRLDRSLASRYCRGVEVCPDFHQDEAGLIRFLLALAERYPGPRVLFPASDDCAHLLARHHATLAAAYALPTPGADVMARIIDKRAQYGAAAALGIPIPETHFPADRDAVARLAPTLAHYPYVIKPLIAHRWRRADMSKVACERKGIAATDPASLLLEYERIAGADSEVMIQEVIGGPDEALFTFLAYVDARGEALAWCIRRKIRQFPVDFGYCTLTVSCHEPTVEAQSLALLRGLGFHGLCGVEWKWHPARSEFQLIEVNARAVNTIALAPACGVDLAWIAFRDQLGLPPEARPAWRDGIKWMNAEQDFWAARTLRLAGRLAPRAWLASLRGPTTHAVFAPDDPWLYPGYAASLLAPLAGRAVRRLLLWLRHAVAGLRQRPTPPGLTGPP